MLWSVGLAWLPPSDSSPLSTGQFIVTRTGLESRCHEHDFCFTPNKAVLSCRLWDRWPCLSSEEDGKVVQAVLWNNFSSLACRALLCARVLVEISWLDFTICFQSAMQWFYHSSRVVDKRGEERENVNTVTQCHVRDLPYILVLSSYCQIYHDMHEKISSHSISFFRGTPSLMLISISR